MDPSVVKAYRTLSEAQNSIARAHTLDEALSEGLRAIVEGCGAQSGAVWYADTGKRLRPYFWVEAPDLTSRSYAPGEGSVGRVFESQKAERLLDFAASPDSATAADFADSEVTSAVCAPLTARSGPFGCMQIVNKLDGTPFTEEEADVFEMMCMLAALAIEDSGMLEPTREFGERIARVRSVTREFGSGENVVKVLRGVNLDVYEGEFLVLLGESGCGKSTLLNILGGMDRPTSGEVECLGYDLAHADAAELCRYRRECVGFVFQGYNLMPNLTAHQNLELVAALVDDPMDADEALSAVDLTSRASNYPSQMSGGQQQRVSIARALMKRPRLMLADEPTAALDYQTSIEVLSVMGQVVEDGTTMVMVTHNEEICRMADRVVRLKGGRVAEVRVNRRKAQAAELVW